MITSDQLEKIFTIFKQVNSSLHGNLQLYNPAYKYRPNDIVKLEKDRKITAVWLDFESVNEW